MNRPIRSLALAGVAALALVLTFLQPSASDAAVKTKNRERITSYAVLKMRDKSGKVIYRHWYGPATKGRALRIPRVLKPLGSGTGGSPSGSGTDTVTVTQSDKVPVIGDTLWTFKVFVTWKWNRANQTVNPTDYGYDPWQDLDSSWSWDGVVGRDNHYFDYNSSNPLADSGNHHMVWGKYDGPAVGSINRHEYPKNVVEVHDDGTWWWSTKCCSQPS
jgi:hypothetical protein